MTPGLPRRRGPGRGPAAVAGAVLLALLLDGLLACCGPAAGGARGTGTTTAGTATAGTATAGAAGASSAAVAVPTSADDLGGLLLTQVPSGLPRMPDDTLQPRAGEKSLDDVAAYADDPAHERQVLRDYGFRWGWERFWGRSAAETSVFVEQFTAADHARSFAADLAANEAGHYHAMLHETPPDLPAGCRLLTVGDPPPGVGLTGPTALAWCAHGLFSVAVSVAGTSVEAATAELVEVARAQLARLPA